MSISTYIYIVYYKLSDMRIIVTQNLSFLWMDQDMHDVSKSLVDFITKIE